MGHSERGVGAQRVPAQHGSEKEPRAPAKLIWELYGAALPVRSRHCGVTPARSVAGESAAGWEAPRETFQRTTHKPGRKKDKKPELHQSVECSFK